MSGALIPAGWLSSRDVLYRVVQWIHNTYSGEPLEERAALRAAGAILGDALSLSRPSLAAFVAEGGEWFQVPSTMWLHLIDRLDEDEDALWSALAAEGLHGSFGNYAGRSALFNNQHFVGFMQGVGGVLGGASAAPASRDPDRPWRDYSSISAWLVSHEATKFADALLAEKGVKAPRPIDRNRALFDHIESHGGGIQFESIRNLRVPSRMRPGPNKQPL